MTSVRSEMTQLSFEEFAAQSRALGFDEIVERRWPPGTVLETHTHPFAVKAVLVEGEMWLTQGGETRHLAPGDGFEVELGAAHAERYGAAGAVYWVARRNAAR
jgi:mannose-6-phosphate isomerase-like protein (cupin superfamily)